MSQFEVGGKTDGLENETYLRPRVYESIADKVDYNRAVEFVDGLGKLCEGYRSFSFVSGNFIFGEVLEAMVDRGLMTIKRLSLQTLSMSDENIDSLSNVIDMSPGIESFRIALSDYFYSHESKPGGLVPYLYERLDDGRCEFDCAFAGIHTKIITVETMAGGKLVLHGSANLRSSRNIEQLCIDCDAGLYDYIESFNEKVFSAYSVVNKDSKKHKSPRASKLWRLTHDG